MKRTAALISVAGLFLVGVLVGILGTHLHYAKQLEGPRRPGGRSAQHFINRLERELDLTAEQRRRIDEIIQDSRAEGESIHHEMLPRVRAHMDQTRRHIRDVLTPEQQVRFDELHRHHRRHWEHFVLDRGGQHPPPLPHP